MSWTGKIDRITECTNSRGSTNMSSEQQEEGSKREISGKVSLLLDKVMLWQKWGADIT